ncbi:MAG: hypothetical protein JWQ71_938 [Pedosphaera sp.]|nr:hypothetical protein [Pedosphaera sp.]
MNKSAYWQSRKELKYYQEVLRFARQYAPGGGSVLDVGSHNCDYITWFDWFANRHKIDLRKTIEIEGVKTMQGDFMQFQSPITYDLVLCLQVLEHLREPAAFAQKLLSTGKILIVSVPYRWNAGKCPCHPQDPVDEEKLLQWFKISWSEMTIVTDGKVRRLVAVYRHQG